MTDVEPTTEVEALAWVIVAATRNHLDHAQAVPVAAAVLDAGWVFVGRDQQHPARSADR